MHKCIYVHVLFIQTVGAGQEASSVGVQSRFNLDFVCKCFCLPSAALSCHLVVVSRSFTQKHDALSWRMDDSDNQGLAEADIDAIGHVVFYNEPSAPVTPETRGKSSPFTRNTVHFSEEDLQDLPTVSWAPLADEGMAFESSSVVADSVDSTQYERQHHHRSSSKHRHKHDMAAGSTDSPSESVTGRSHSFSSGFDSSSVASSSGLSATSSYPGPSVSEVSYRPK